MVNVSLVDITWDCEGLTPEECGLPADMVMVFHEDRFPPITPGETITDIEHAISEQVLVALHERYGFNPIGFRIGGLHRREPDMSNNVSQIPASAYEWGSHPLHASEVQNISRQIADNNAIERAQRMTAARRTATSAGQRRVAQVAPDWVTRSAPMVAPRAVPPATEEEMAEFARRLAGTQIGSTRNSGGNGGSAGDGSVGAAFAGAAIGVSGIAPGGGGGGSVAVGTSYHGCDPQPSVAEFLHNLRDCKIKSVIMFFAPILRLRGDQLACPVCEAGENELEYEVLLRGESHTVELRCAACHLRVGPLDREFELKYGSRRQTVQYGSLGAKPDAAFMAFAEELFRWRQDYRSGTKRKSRQSVIIEPEEEGHG